MSCTIVGIKAARNTNTRRITLVMMKLRWVTRFLYSRSIIKPILRKLCWAAAPPELTATTPCFCSRCSCTGVSTIFCGGISIFFFNENIGQRWLGQLEQANDAAILQCRLHNQVGVQIGIKLHLNIVLPAFGHVNPWKSLKPASFRVVIELESCHMASLLAFDLTQATLDDTVSFIDDDDVLTEFFRLLQLMGGEDNRLAAPVHL